MFSFSAKFYPNACSIALGVKSAVTSENSRIYNSYFFTFQYLDLGLDWICNLKIVHKMTPRMVWYLRLLYMYFTY